MVKKKDKLSLWERSEYDVINETETENGLNAVLKVRNNGAMVICNIPKHTPDEEKRIAEDITEAMMQVIYTGQDIRRFKNIEILLD